MRKFYLIFFLAFSLSVTPFAWARTTPEDILNSKREDYNKTVSSYSQGSKNKLSDYTKRIADLNKNQTDLLEENMVRQGEILDEFIYRKKAKEKIEDGISRNLSDPIENARYWLTFAHEAVAYQAAHVYIPNLTGEKNINTDIVLTINSLQGDIGVLKSKVEKSRTIIEDLVSK